MINSIKNNSSLNILIMSDDLAVYNEFNKKLAEFIGLLQTVCPNQQSQLQKAMGLCGMSVNISAKIPVVWFKKNVAIPLGEAINQRDIEKFISIACNVEKTNANNQMDFSIADIIASEAKNIKPEHMNTVWRYMKVLVVCSNNCASDSLLEKMC
jgi:hypothetical protein